MNSLAASLEQGAVLSASRFRRVAWQACSVTLALVVMLVGCATSDPAPEPPVVVTASTWRQVDRDIVAASQEATGQAEEYAGKVMERWRGLVYQRIEADFIPWYTGYWTQRWLSLKVAWYRLSAEPETDPAASRLARYLRRQYQDRVLAPVAEQISPDLIIAWVTDNYVHHFGQQLQAIPLRYGVPAEQFDQHLQAIPVITPTPGGGAHSASLYQIAGGVELDRLPAYGALIERIRAGANGARADGSGRSISMVAQRASERLQAELTTSGAASVTSALVGQAAGMVISIGAMGFSAIAHENRRPTMEARLRAGLSADLDREWFHLLHNPDTGVLAGVYFLTGQIERGLAGSAAPPTELGPPALRFLPGGRLLQDGGDLYHVPVYEAPADQ